MESMELALHADMYITEPVGTILASCSVASAQWRAMTDVLICVHSQISFESHP